MAKPCFASVKYVCSGNSYSLVLLLASVFVSSIIISPYPKGKEIPSSSSQTQSDAQVAMSTAEIFGVKIEKNPPPSKLAELGVTTWLKWGCQPSKFPWTFKATETMYLLEGKVKVQVDGHEGSFEIGAGDLVIFPKGMKITWDVLEPVSKHYSLEN